MTIKNDLYVYRVRHGSTRIRKYKLSKFLSNVNDTLFTVEFIVVVLNFRKEPNPPVSARPVVAMPTIFDAGTFVKLAALIAGNAPVKFAAGKAVRFAPEPCKLLKVPTPAVTLTPELSTVNPAPTIPFVPDNVNAILVSDYSYIYTMVSSLPDGIVIV